jgi:hypothetical protein
MKEGQGRMKEERILKGEGGGRRRNGSKKTEG